MAQAQCPNCGGYKVATERTSQFDPMTGGKPRDYSSIRQIILLVVFVGVFLAVLFALSIPINSVAPTSGMMALVAVGVAFVVAGLAGAWVSGIIKKSSESQNRAITIYDFACQLCVYRWTWQNNQPYPKVNVNPALIQQGEQRLQEEARRNQEQMEAAWVLQQQQKK